MGLENEYININHLYTKKQLKNNTKHSDIIKFIIRNRTNHLRQIIQRTNSIIDRVNNSSPVVGAAIEGVPIFVTDPSKSQCSEVANLDLSMIEKPSMPDRQPWVERLSMFHWNFDELENGNCWRHMRNYCQ
jgi:hypothetical protein